MSAEIEDINGNLVRVGWIVEILDGPMAGSVGTLNGVRGNRALVLVDEREVEVDPESLLLKERRRSTTLMTQQL